MTMVQALPSTVPEQRMREARRGTAFFSRILHGLGDDELVDAASDGRSRTEIVARVALQARATAEVFEALRMGSAYHPHATTFDDEAVRFAATLNPHALRNLHAHAVVHLNVEWRDLPDDLWHSPVTLWDITPATPAILVEERRRLIWTSAILLDPRARTRGVPPDLRPESDESATAVAT